MIDIENGLYTYIKSKISANVNFTPEFVRNPASFPHVDMVVQDNTFHAPDNSGEEHMSKILVQFNFYSNKKSGRKQECKTLANTVDDAMRAIGFYRIRLSPAPNIEDATIYRMAGMYSAVVDVNKTVYRR